MSESNGKRFIDRLIAASPMDRRKTTLLGQDVYFKPVTRKALADAMPKDGVKREPDYVGLFALVAFAEAEDGSKLFAVKDIDALRECVAVDLVRQLEGFMMATILPDAQEADKTVAADPLSASA
jgi:hypothetical protein